MKKSGFQKFLAKLGVERVDESDPFFVSDMPENFDDAPVGDAFAEQDDPFDDAPAALRRSEPSAVLNIRRVEPGEEPSAPARPREPFRRSIFRNVPKTADERPAAPIVHRSEEPQRSADEVDDLMDDLMGQAQTAASAPAQSDELDAYLEDEFDAYAQEQEAVSDESEAANADAAEPAQAWEEEPQNFDTAQDVVFDEPADDQYSDASEYNEYEEFGQTAAYAEPEYDTAAETVPGYDEAAAQEPVFERPAPEQADGGVREAFVRPHNHGVVVALGMFDGVHAGHQHMLAMARRDADQLGLPLHVVTFYEHPASILTGKPVPYLSTLEDRIALLTQHGMDCFNVYHFTPQFASMDYREFIAMLVRELDMTHIVIGQDAVFGRGGRGNAKTLMAEAGDFGISVHVVPDVTANGQKVSSSAIRAAAARGDIAFANACLTRPYAVVGTVSRGAQRGALLGFPTANLSPTPGMLVPANGVYVSCISIQEGEMMPAVTNIGVHPTVDALQMPVIETHILDYSGDCYDQHVRVELLQMIRPEQKFGTFAQLSAQIDADVAAARAYFEAQPGAKA